MTARLVLWCVSGAAALFLLIGGLWLLSLPPAPAARAASPISKQEADATIAALKPRKLCSGAGE